MLNKPKILILIDWFTPGFKAGGPIKSVTNIVNSLHKTYDFYIVTSDRDINETLPYKKVQLNRWIKKENYNIIYLSPEERSDWLKNNLAKKEYDAYYFNSLFSKNFTLQPLLKLIKLNLDYKATIAPRGMLGEGALAIKPLKKKLFLALTRTLGYYKKVTWHATNLEEKNDITTNFGAQSTVKIASNISLCIINRKEIIKSKDNLNIVFFSRISPKKNLLYALQLLIGLKHIKLDIYGSIEDDVYWQKCKQLILDYKINANYKGEILPVNVTKTLSNYHFMLLPTLHENYGHVIVEALTAGCGLIISDNTPWRNLEKNKIGWDINLNNNANFIATLKSCILMEQTEYNSIRNNCYNFVEHKINTNKEIEDTKNLFNTITIGINPVKMLLQGLYGMLLMPYF